MDIVCDVAALRDRVRALRRAGETVALVPTMGALHEGHVSLVRLARQHASRAVVSIFVNPAQFAPTEDFSTYPRTFEADIAGLRGLADLVWAPAKVTVMYPPDFATKVRVGGPAVVGLEDKHRPHFFEGVATVVAKLLLQCLPDVAIFGEKDFQQLRVIQRMSADLDIPASIIGAPTIRDVDGLALSSRNAYLSKGERAIAPILHATLRRVASEIRSGKTIDTAVREGISALLAAGFSVDYLEARDTNTLEPVNAASTESLRLLAAARLGATRLIDNIGV
jgi:pantoate--beta-alanine ligase